MTSTRSFVVVPDGLAATHDGRTSSEPSFVYRTALDFVATTARAGDQIYLAPANTFGGPKTEQQAAADYLRSKDIAAAVIAPAPAVDGYVDTRGNAVLLRAYLEQQGRWPLNNASLVAYHIHLPRARLIFTQEGFTFEDAIATACTGKVPQEKVVPRLWYYRHRFFHRCYEVLAYLLFFFRIR